MQIITALCHALVCDPWSTNAFVKWSRITKNIKQINYITATYCITTRVPQIKASFTVLIPWKLFYFSDTAYALWINISLEVFFSLYQNTSTITWIYFPSADGARVFSKILCLSVTCHDCTHTKIPNSSASWTWTF